MFKHGQKVQCNIKGTEINDAKISINKDGTPFICQNEGNGHDAEDKLGYMFSWMLNKDFTFPNVQNLRPFKKSFDYPIIGDEYMNRFGISFFVLGVCGKVIFLSGKDKDVFFGGFTKEELVKSCYTIVENTPEEPIEVTMSEVCNIFGRNVKIKKD